jgi:RNA polymerase sigma factor (sigma-70 family)
MEETDPGSNDRVDVRLLAEIAGGVEQAFVELYRRRHNDVYRFAFAMAKSRSFAQDVTQEVFLNVLENAHRFDTAKGSVRAWLFGCARHVTLDRLRSSAAGLTTYPPTSRDRQRRARSRTSESSACTRRSRGFPSSIARPSFSWSCRN